jgi:hypothetical protein
VSRLVAVSAFVLIAVTATTTEVTIRRDFREAARAGDLSRFDAALDHARSFIETMKLGKRRNAFRRAILAAEDVSRVWHFAVADPNGLFYDDERLPFFYDHLAADYPAYKPFIEEYRVIDRSGLPHYPTRETRDFLLKQMENTAPHSP